MAGPMRCEASTIVTGRPVLTPDAANPEALWPDGGLWPREFQNLELFMRKGHVTNWDYYPEYAEADLFDLRTFDLWARAQGFYRSVSPALAGLVLVYCFWIAYADVDGFRIDAAKHMSVESLRTFCDSIREFAQGLGKERFLLVGEITGGREQAWETVDQAGLDAALGIEDVPGKLERMVTGRGEPSDYFSVFRNWQKDDQAKHRWYRNNVVTLIDDHDQVRKGSAKARFCAEAWRRGLVFNAVAAQLTTMGIPCLYYGTEQAFDSGGQPSASDLVLRETMFGGSFGGKRTRGRHFFNEDEPLYRAVAALAELRRKLIALRRGRQCLHEISGDGLNFGLPRLYGDRMRAIVAWSRLFVDQELLVALNTDQEQSLTVYSTVAPLFRAEGDRLGLIFHHAPSGASPPAETVVKRLDDRLAVELTLPPAGFAIYQAPPGLARLGAGPIARAVALEL